MIKLACCSRSPSYSAYKTSLKWYRTDSVMNQTSSRLSRTSVELSIRKWHFCCKLAQWAFDNSNYAAYRNDNYEPPLVSLFKLLEGEEPICKILVDLLPELFVQKIFVSETPFSVIFNCNSLKSKTILLTNSMQKSRKWLTPQFMTTMFRYASVTTKMR